MSAVNGEKNFGAYHLSLPALRKGNLSIYRPKSNSVIVSRRNMSPILIKIINEIKSTMKFNLDDYDRLKVSLFVFPFFFARFYRRIMKSALPESAKMSKEAKNSVQECVSEFIGSVVYTHSLLSDGSR